MRIMRIITGRGDLQFDVHFEPWWKYTSLSQSFSSGRDEEKKNLHI
jgi:hypothetical protein